MVRGPGFEPGNPAFETGTVASYVSRELAIPPGVEPGSNAHHRPGTNNTNPATGSASDEQKIAVALPKATVCLSALAELMGMGRGWQGRQSA